MKTRFKVALSLIIILFTIYGGVLDPALAHGPSGSSKIQVDNESVGPYKLLVATSPEPIAEGPMDVWVRVADAETDSLLRNAVVIIEATPPSGGPALTAQATHDHAGNAFDYVAHIEINDTGEWDFIIYVEDDLGQADVSFTGTVERVFNIVFLVELVFGLILVAVVIGIFLRKQSADLS